jgi:hypothetical protein
MKTTVLLIAVILGLPVPNADADSAFALHAGLDWELRRDRDGIEVYTANVPGSKYNAVRSMMLVQAPVQNFVAVVLDTSACSTWVSLCKESYVVKRQTDTDYFLYTYTDMPWPATDRDAVAHVRWSLETETQAVHMIASIVAGVVERSDKAVRLSEGTTSWTFTPTEKGTLVERLVHLNPGGGLPAWMTNMLLVDSPFDTLQTMRKLVTSGVYEQTSIPFLIDDDAE